MEPSFAHFRGYAKASDIGVQLEDPEEFEHWEKLVRAVEAQEGGINRNASPGAIALTRDVYDRFLARFPLFFGYWKKYADLEFMIAGTEAAEMVSRSGLEQNCYTTKKKKTDGFAQGLRTRRRQHRHLCRFVGELLRLQA